MFLLLTITISAQEMVNCPSAPPSRLIVGQRAEVIASGGSNLRLTPSVSVDTIITIPAGTQVEVADGPVCADGYAWWKLSYQGDYGWSAEGTADFYWLAPIIVQQYQIGAIRIEALPALGVTLRGERQARFTTFQLEGYPISGQYHPPIVNIFDADSLPATEEILQAEQAIDRQDFSLLPIGNLNPAWVDLPDGHGVRYLIPFKLTADSDALYPIYVYRGFMDDGRLVSITLPIAMDGDTITPDITLLDAMARSIEITAPLENSALWTYQDDYIRFDVHPTLAYAIEAQTITSEPPHHAWLFTGYTQGDAIIRLYETTDLSGDWLIRLQQILTRQPRQVPAIPILAYQGQTQTIRGEIGYRRFLNGEGVLGLVQYAETLYYSYQGFSDNRTYYLSLMMPIVTDGDSTTPPLFMFEQIIDSLQIAE